MSALKTKPKRDAKPVSNPINMAIVHIDPDRALELLQGNTQNRNIRKRLVSQYARDMKNGARTQTGDPIRLSPEGTLLDGQHRLCAIVESGVTTPIVIVRGVERKFMLNIDTGARRTFADMLRLLGHVNCNALGAVIRFGYKYEAGTMMQTTYLSNAELLAWIDANPDVTRHVQAVHQTKGHRTETGGALTALYYLSYKCDKFDFEQFYDKMKSGAGLPEGSPILALRRHIANAAISSKNTHPLISQAVTIKAWNAYIEGRDVKILSYKPGGATPEPFPTINTGS